jgi:Ca-activated chloride channel family protein
LPFTARALPLCSRPKRYAVAVMRFEFTHPWYLLLALAVPPLILWWLFQGRNALRHSATQQIIGPLTFRAKTARGGGAVLRALGLLLIVVALAGPRTPDLRTRIDTEGIAIVMALDISGSMATEDFDWNYDRLSRIGAVKKAFRVFVEGGTMIGSGPEETTATTFEGRPTDLIGIVTFAARPETVCPLTLSHSAVLRILERSEPLSVPNESETNISDSVTIALHRLESAGKRPKVLILLTDGEHNVVDPRSGWTPTQVGQLAMSLKIPIYTIDAGASEDPTDPKRIQAKKTLDELATMTGGQAFQADSMTKLLKACKEIDKLERQEIHSFQYRRYYELYPWFALAAFVVFMTAVLLDVTIWRRIP